MGIPRETQFQLEFHKSSSYSSWLESSRPASRTSFQRGTRSFPTHSQWRDSSAVVARIRWICPAKFSSRRQGYRRGTFVHRSSEIRWWTTPWEDETETSRLLRWAWRQGAPDKTLRSALQYITRMARD